MTQEFRITIEWDDEAKVFAVVDSDVPGLATESPTWEGLIENIRHLAPMLLVENGVVPAPEISSGGEPHRDRVPYDFIVHHAQRLQAFA